ncbi:hypothetical protein AnigIFM60653_009537 [Aspergillus niger]|nr:hypothetical protein AnigIFM60653_009537 [Aspergillus niger]
MSSWYTYSPLPPGPYTRMIRLLPHKDRSAPVECTLFDYDLFETHRGKHLYEALSYTWGSGIKPQPILIDGSLLSVTESLYTALLYLRDHQLERTLWVDAVCINQEEDDEKAKQIPYMRAIYAQADRVLVWLGEPDDSDGDAFDTIRRLAEDKVLMLSTSANVLSSGADYNACVKLFRNNWFRRIWVLQEVGVARCVVLQCGFTQVDGYAFCEGLSSLETSSLPEYISPVIPLIRGSLFRSRCTPKSRDTHSIGELIDMYHSHLATVPHDKIYALLGLCSDDLDTPCLRPNYHSDIDEVAKQVVSTSTVVIKGKGWILGRVISVEKSNYSDINQKIELQFHDSAVSRIVESQWGSKWRLQASATPIHINDVVCLMKGNSNPTIVRLGKHRIHVIMSTAVPQVVSKRSSEGLSFRELSDMHPQQLQPTDGTLVDLFITWDIIKSSSDDSHHLSEVSNMVPNCLEQASDEEALRCRQLVMEDIVVDIVIRSQFGLHFQPLKLLLCQTQLKVPVSERVLWAAVSKIHGGPLLPFLLDDKRESPAITEASVQAATSTSDLRSLLFYPVDRASITEALVLRATETSGAVGSIDAFYKYQRSLPISEYVIQAALEHSDAPGILGLFARNERSLPISESMIEMAIAMPRGYDILRQIFSPLDGGPPITENLVKYAAGGYIASLSLFQYFTFQREMPPPKNDEQAAKHSEVFRKHSKNLVMLFYNYKKSVVIAAAKDPEVGKKIKRMVLGGQRRRER